MANNFRDKHPIRTYTGNETDYRKYKLHLAKDFFNRCGYTDCPDFWFGGKNNFHIDHFIPWKKSPKKPNLKTDYSNLVYACSYVNIVKSNDEGAYVDPCDVDFNKHFTRDAVGNILPIPQSKEANYMYKRLKFFMRRYQIIWMLDSIYNKMERLQIVIDGTPSGVYKDDLLKTQGELGGLLIKYLKYLKSEQ
jgi:hypothetical protein